MGFTKVFFEAKQPTTVSRRHSDLATTRHWRKHHKWPSANALQHRPGTRSLGYLEWMGLRRFPRKRFTIHRKNRSFSGWWLSLPLWKIWKSVGMIMNHIYMETWKSCSKPPTSSEWFFSQWFWGFAIGRYRQHLFWVRKKMAFCLKGGRKFIA